MSTETGDQPTVRTFEGSADRLGNAFYPVYDYVFEDDDPFVTAVERKLAEARMPATVEMYLSRAVGVGLVTGVVLWFVGIFLGYLLATVGVLSGPLLGVPLPENGVLVTLVRTLRVPFLVVVLGFVLGGLGFALGFGSVLAIPYSRASARRREINMLLSDSVSFMYALSIGGLNQLELLEAMAKAEDTYGEVSQEFQAIVRETNSLDTDYRTAIRHQLEQTPSDELREFLVDMLAVINSGGDMTGFLDDKKHKYMRAAKQEQEQTLDVLELLGEMYITLSLFPLLLVIILVIMNMLGNASQMMLYVTVYGLIPLIAAAFLVLVTTVKQDEFGDGIIRPREQSAWLETQSKRGLRDLGFITAFSGTYHIFDRIERKKGLQETVDLLRNPHLFFRDNPLYTLALSVPASISLVVAAALSGAVPLSWDGVVAQPVWATFVYCYVPLFLVVTPLAVFHEWDRRSRRALLGNLSDTLLKLSTVNDTGATTLESIRTVSETSSDKLADEFRILYRKVNYGMSLKESLIEFNNKYQIPRLARTVKLITKAQEASSHISEVLSTAAKASEVQDDLARERRSRTLMQVAIVLMTYVTLLGVMALLKVQFIDVMADFSTGQASGAGAGMAFGGVDADLLSLMFFHAVTIQAISAGLIAGYLRDASLRAGAKFVVVLLTISLVVWMVVG
ncbi:type II secretion system F family protein [Halomicroarcula sp. S1AR25-4]|uniref:type II secretion system F family protein n=1 Tax=Haloarcula sp. S1AR25-4 TaxID=2950538 RepID=UPI0028744BB8|nr:type II secretion system F family protein [Halomicroarcula sp. S1AR25-4]MDS0278417.1 type II secretion system F family protein [Halomicroarcula sp. S1AR25-4]